MIKKKEIIVKKKLLSYLESELSNGGCSERYSSESYVSRAQATF